MRKLITILLILFAVQGFGQVYQADKTHGRQYYRIKIDSTLHIPTFCGVPTLRSSVVGNQAAIGFDSCNNRLYFYNPKDSSWNIVGSGGVIIGGDGVDSVTYSSNELCQWVDGVSTCYRLNKFFDSTSYNEGKIYHWNNGIVRDSINISDTQYYKYPVQKIGDTTVVRVDSMPNMIITADTSDMPGNGVPTLDMVNARMGGGNTDTSHLSDRINQKVNISDTASMLTPYLRKNAIAAGTNISFTGTGTDADPIVINSSGSGGSSYTTQTYTSGSSVTIADASDWLIVNPSSVADSITIILPENPDDRQEVTISFGGDITGGDDVVTNLTISPNTGQGLVQNFSPTYFQSGESIRYRYNSSTSKWYAQ